MHGVAHGFARLTFLLFWHLFCMRSPQRPSGSNSALSAHCLTAKEGVVGLEQLVAARKQSLGGPEHTCAGAGRRRMRGRRQVVGGHWSGVAWPIRQDPRCCGGAARRVCDGRPRSRGIFSGSQLPAQELRTRLGPVSQVRTDGMRGLAGG